MDLPQKAYDAFDKCPVKKGTIIKATGYFTHRKNHPKFFIVLNKNPQENPFVCVLSTSDIDFYLRNPRFNQDALTILGNRISCFPLDTVINCREIHLLSRERIKEFMKAGILSFEGELPQDLLEKIDDIVRSSRLIAPVDKKRIL